ncbi:MAG: metal-dependent hydrolase [Candidatus Micrarchaeota archaeon]
MDSLFHFIFSIIAALAVDLHKKHKLPFVIFAASFAVAIDFDHFLGWDPSYIKPLHNIWVAFFLPLLLFYLAYHYERNKKPYGIEAQKFFLVLLAMLTGHLVADMFYGDIRLLYPLTNAAYSFSDLPIPQPIEKYDFVTTQGVALLFYSLILLPILFAEEFIKWHEEKHESMRKSLSDMMRELF